MLLIVATPRKELASLRYVFKASSETMTAYEFSQKNSLRTEIRVPKLELLCAESLALQQKCTRLLLSDIVHVLTFGSPCQNITDRLRGYEQDRPIFAPVSTVTLDYHPFGNMKGIGGGGACYLHAASPGFIRQ